MKKILPAIFIVVLIISASCNTQETSKTSFIPQELTEAEIRGGKMTPEILWKFGRVSGTQLSPDGTMVLFTVSRHNSENNTSLTRIYSIPAAGGEEPRALTGDLYSAYHPRFINGGDAIAYLTAETGETQIWQMNVDGSGKEQLSFIEGGITGFEFSPVANLVYYLKDVKLDSTANEIHEDLPLANARIIDDLMYRHWNKWHDYKYSHIFVTKLGEDGIPEGRDIMEGERWDAPLSPYFDASEISWSPDGNYIAYTCKKLTGKEYAVSTNSDIYLYNVKDETTENLTKAMMGYDKYPSFSNDGQYLAWQSMETPGYEADKDRLMVMNLETREIRYLTADFDQSAGSLTWSADDEKIYFISGIEATYQLYEIDVESEAIRKLTDGDHNYTGFQLGDGYLVGEKMSMSMATEIFKVDLNTGEETQLSFVNKNIYDNIEMGKVEERWVTTTDNKQMKVWVIYPPGFDPSKKYPALLYCQGGPQSAVSQFFSYRWNFQMMAANDYVIIAPNRRGLPTFGTAWNEQISGDYGGQNIKDYLSASDALKTEDFIDEDRMGAIGASYGGFSVFYLAGHHEGRFKAFISHCGIFNFESMYASTEEMFFVNHDMEGAFWETPKPPSYEFSPHRFVDKWDTPIMIITGENDFRIPYTESLQAFNSAQLNGVPSKLLVFPEETHFVLQPQNSILWQREFFGWLDKYLK